MLLSRVNRHECSCPTNQSPDTCPFEYTQHTNGKLVCDGPRVVWMWANAQSHQPVRYVFTNRAPVLVAIRCHLVAMRIVGNKDIDTNIIVQCIGNRSPHDRTSLWKRGNFRFDKSQYDTENLEEIIDGDVLRQSYKKMHRVTAVTVKSVTHRNGRQRCQLNDSLFWKWIRIVDAMRISRMPARSHGAPDNRMKSVQLHR